MPGDHAYLKAVADHEHGHVVNPELLLQVLRMTGVTEAFAGHRPLVDGSGYQHVDIAFLYVGNRAFKRAHGTFGRFRGGLARFHENVVGQAVDYIDTPGMDVFCRSYHVGVHLVDFMDLPAVEPEDLGRTVDYRGE